MKEKEPLVLSTEYGKDEDSSEGKRMRLLKLGEYDDTNTTQRRAKLITCFFLIHSSAEKE